MYLEQQYTPPKKGRLKPYILIIVLVTAIISGGYFYTRDDHKASFSNAEVRDQDSGMTDAQRVMSKVSKLIVVDPSQGPTVSEIVDIDNLKSTNSFFFRNAKNKDWLLIYPDIAIIYRESENILVNVGPVVQTNQKSK